MNKEKSHGGGWRYQAVFTETEDKTCEFGICEVYLDQDGKLEAWTESKSIAPYGNTLEELIGDIRLMLKDTVIWKAVPFLSLHIGMTFERLDD